MSTLKVNTIQDASGGNASTSEQLQQGRAKAWVNFDGTVDSSSVDPRNNSFNVSGVTDEGVGLYTITFTTNTFSNTNYCFTGSVNNTESDGSELAGAIRGPVGVFQSNSGTKTAANIRVETRFGASASNNGAVFDFRNVYCVFFGD